jgi:hypothetical protein
MLLTYVPEFKGVIISYRRVNIVGEPLGCINGLYPFINFKVSVEFVVFAPQINSQLVGKVKRVGQDVIRILVHGLFPATLDKWGVPEGYIFDRATESYNYTTAGATAPAEEVKGGLSKSAKKRIQKAAQAKAKVEGGPIAAPENPENPPLARGVWIKFTILSLDRHGKIYQWKATAKGEGLGIVSAPLPLEEPGKETKAAPPGEVAEGEVAEEEVAEGEVAEGGAAADTPKHTGRKKKQRVS